MVSQDSLNTTDFPPALTLHPPRREGEAGGETRLRGDAAVAERVAVGRVEQQDESTHGAHESAQVDEGRVPVERHDGRDDEAQEQSEQVGSGGGTHGAVAVRHGIIMPGGAAGVNL